MTDNIFHTDLTFITNEAGQTLRQRFEQLIKDSRFFDCLVGYFYISGFHSIYKSLEKTEKIRILIGIGLSKETYDLIKEAQDTTLSHYETKELTSRMVEDEMANSDDKTEIEEGIQKFIEWIKQKKLEIRAYPSQNIHAKLYIMTFQEGDRDVGRVITGSSNFTKSGFEDNLEFNVELKNRADYEFSCQKFNALWEDAVDVSEKFVQTINEKTYLNDNITPYQLYLKFLYEYFKDELSQPDKLREKYLPENFKKFEYQEQAVLNAKKVLEEYGGVFLSDVVGLGKTYMTAMLVSELDGRTMIIAPPALLNRNNPGSWPNVFSDFQIPAEFISIGKLDEAKRKMENREYKNIVIDESHRFRNESTVSYEDLAEICRGKRIILVSATPYNNSPKDIFSQIKLFQNPRLSTIPGLSDLESFFSEIQAKLKNAARKGKDKNYLAINKQIAKKIRDKVLKYIMIRRTRSEIEKYFKDDLKKNNITFPEIKDPKPSYYQFNDEEDRIFTETISLLTQKFTYARYTPLLYLKTGITPIEAQAQKNMGGFMKVLLVKRLESSFYAFRKSIDRFIKSYEMFIKEYEKGNVYVSKKNSTKIFELLEQDNDEEIQMLINEGKAECYKTSDFREEFLNNLKNDLEILKKIKNDWNSINRDPKIETLISNLKTNNQLANNKIIIFTESKETAEYLVENINKEFGNISILFHGSSFEFAKDIVIENFDARVKNKRDDYRILVTTDVLAEGVNLHRSNIVINYDIPWNPTKLMQRVGRVNRIDTSFNEIYTFNFFPTSQSDSEIELTNIARSKIESFLTMLGNDTSILTEGEPVESHELFDRLTSNKFITENEEEESELKYFRIIEDIRDNEPDLFEKIKKLPKKARSAKLYSETYKDIAISSFLVTFFRKGKLMKFFSSTYNNKTIELDFLTTAKIFESLQNENKEKISVNDYYELINKNKTAFFDSNKDERILPKKRGGSNNNVTKLIKILKAHQINSKQLTEDQELYLKKLIELLVQGTIPIQTVKNILKEINKLGEDINNPLKVVAICQNNISKNFFKGYYGELSTLSEEKSEVILSLYVLRDIMSKK